VAVSIRSLIPSIYVTQGLPSFLVMPACGDDAAYADFRDRYRDMAKTLGFEGHIAWAEAMP
jgi:hypothetical protein